jgi:CMP-N,N'-diacetyllegionaminic acid synthase
MKILAVITARSGSKGLKDKNIKELCGLPLCAYSINAAKDSGIFSEIHFSTDSQEYADIAMRYGASVPFLRDAILATDTASSWDVIKAVITNYRKNGQDFDAVMLLQPTVPFRSAEDIRNAVSLMTEKKANAIVSVTDPAHSPLWCSPLPEDGNMEVFHERFRFLTARQKLEKHFALNGAIYLVRIPYLFSCNDIYEEKCYSYYMPPERSFDIDSQLDFDWCEYWMTRYTAQK